MKDTGMVTTGFNYSPVCGLNPLSCRIRVKISKRYNVRFVCIATKSFTFPIVNSQLLTLQGTAFTAEFLQVVPPPILGSAIHKPTQTSQSSQYII